MRIVRVWSNLRNVADRLGAWKTHIAAWKLFFTAIRQRKTLHYCGVYILLPTIWKLALWGTTQTRQERSPFHYDQQTPTKGCAFANSSQSNLRKDVDGLGSCETRIVF